MMTDRQRGSAGARSGRRWGPTVLSLGVGDCAVLLSEVKPQLAFVSEVEVTLFTLKGGGKKITLQWWWEKNPISVVFLTWSSLSLSLSLFFPFL